MSSLEEAGREGRRREERWMHRRAVGVSGGEGTPDAGRWAVALLGGRSDEGVNCGARADAAGAQWMPGLGSPGLGGGGPEADSLVYAGYWLAWLGDG